MCKEMMDQRNRIEKMLKEDLERCLENIRNNGCWDVPSVMVDMEKLFIANREYFEHQGFLFEPDTRIENMQVRYYACLKLGGEGTLGRECWKKIYEARDVFMKMQRKKISEKLSENHGEHISVDMKKLLFENKMFFEESGYIFQPYIREKNGKFICLAYMRKI